MDEKSKPTLLRGACYSLLFLLVINCRKDKTFLRHLQIFKEFSCVMDEKSKPTFTGRLA
jgi:hypothetical protein